MHICTFLHILESLLMLVNFRTARFFKVRRFISAFRECTRLNAANPWRKLKSAVDLQLDPH